MNLLLTGKDLKKKKKLFTTPPPFYFFVLHPLENLSVLTPINLLEHCNQASLLSTVCRLLWQQTPAAY